jgi:hypothetical protein
VEEFQLTFLNEIDITEVLELRTLAVAVVVDQVTMAKMATLSTHLLATAVQVSSSFVTQDLKLAANARSNNIKL